MTVNGTEAAVVAREFIVDKLLFWMTLVAALAGTAGIAFKLSTWLRKRVNKDKDEIVKRIDNLETVIHQSIRPDHIVNQFEKYDNMFKIIDNRLDGLEKQILTQMNVVLESQKKVSEFIEKYTNRNQ